MMGQFLQSMGGYGGQPPQMPGQQQMGGDPLGGLGQMIMQHGMDARRKRQQQPQQGGGFAQQFLGGGGLGLLPALLMQAFK